MPSIARSRMTLRHLTPLLIVLLSASCQRDKGPDSDLQEVGDSFSGLQKSLGGTNGDYNYCNQSVCNSGEGDCDSNAECAAGLICGKNNGALFGSPADWDYCVPPHCQNGQQDGDETGIDIGGSCSTTPACPGVNGDPTFCTTACPCDVGEGDCDSNAECAAGLACGTNNGAQFGLAANLDVCVLPHCTNRRHDANEVGVDCGGPDCGTCVPACRNGVLDPGEQCDDGNQTAGD